MDTVEDIKRKKAEAEKQIADILRDLIKDGLFVDCVIVRQLRETLPQKLPEPAYSSKDAKDLPVVPFETAPRIVVWIALGVDEIPYSIKSDLDD